MACAIATWNEHELPQNGTANLAYMLPSRDKMHSLDLLKTIDDPGTRGCISANLDTFSRSWAKTMPPSSQMNFIPNDYSLAITNRELVLYAVRRQKNYEPFPSSVTSSCDNEILT